MHKSMILGLATLFFMMAVFGLLGFDASFAEGGSFEVPNVDDHFEEVKPGPEPADEKHFTQKVEKKSHSPEKTGNPIKDGWNWFTGKVSEAWEDTKEFFGDLWDWFTEVCAKMVEVVVDGLSAAWEWIKDNIGYIAAGAVLIIGVVLCFVAPPLGASILIGMGLSFGISWLINGEITQDTFLEAAIGGVLGAIGLGIAGGAARALAGSLGSRLITSITGSRLLGPLASGLRNLAGKLPAPLRSIFSRAGVVGSVEGAGTSIADDLIHGRGINWRNAVIAGVGGAALVGITAFAVPVFNKVKDLDLGMPAITSNVDEFFDSLKKCFATQPSSRYTAMVRLPCGDHTPEPRTPKVEKDTSLTPGTPEHKQNRWEVYQANGGKWSYEQWSKTYDSNMEKASRSHELVENYRQTLDWKHSTTQYSVDTKHGVRIIDIADPNTLRAIEHKTTTKTDGSRGYFSRDEHIREELLKDKYLVEVENWDITWVFENADASQPLIDDLKAAGIKVEFK